MEPTIPRPPPSHIYTFLLLVLKKKGGGGYNDLFGSADIAVGKKHNAFVIDQSIVHTRRIVSRTGKKKKKERKKRKQTHKRHERKPHRMFTLMQEAKCCNCLSFVHKPTVCVSPEYVC